MRYWRDPTEAERLYGRRAGDDLSAALQRFDDHIEQYQRDTRRFEAALADHDHEQTRMHEVNTESLDELKASIRKLQVIYYFASSIIVLIGLAFTAPGSKLIRFFFYGSP